VVDEMVGRKLIGKVAMV